jgi:hypothetical protein
MPRDVSDAEGTTWTCVQAYAGLSEGGENEEAARVEGEEDRYHVVCTPSGGAQSVRLQLQGNWESSLSDEDLLREIEAWQEQQG